MKIRALESKEIVVNVDDKGVSQLRFACPNIEQYFDLVSMGKPSDVFPILDRMFLGFVEKPIIENKDGVIEYKTFKDMREIQSSVIVALCTRCIEAVTAHIHEVRNLEKKSK